MDKAFRTMTISDAFASEVFAKYGLQPPDKKTCDAIQELVGRILFMRKRDLQDVVLYQGTFPLRAALVRQLERSGGLEPGRNHFEEWIESHNSSLKHRNPVNLEQNP